MFFFRIEDFNLHGLDDLHCKDGNQVWSDVPKTETWICHHSFATLLSRKCVTVEKCTQSGSCGSHFGFWDYICWLESLASLLQIYQGDSCDSSILTNQSGGFWLGRYVSRSCWGRVSVWTVYHPCFTKVFLASFAPWSSRCFQLPNCICVGSLQKPRSDTSNAKCFCGKISSKIFSLRFL